MRPLFGALALGFASWVGVGCVSAHWTDGNDVPLERVDQIRLGETTKDDILSWFGAPESITDPGELRRLIEDSELLPEEVVDLPLADVLVFQLTRVRLRGLMLGVYNRVELRSVSDRLVVFFDDQDRVTHYGFRENAHAVD